VRLRTRALPYMDIVYYLRTLPYLVMDLARACGRMWITLYGHIHNQRALPYLVIAAHVHAGACGLPYLVIRTHYLIWSFTSFITWTLDAYVLHWTMYLFVLGL